MSQSTTEVSNDACVSAAPKVSAVEKRSAVTMGLLWITMVTGFPTVLVGFDWFRRGFTLDQVVVGIAMSCAVLLLYWIPTCYMGAVSGLNYGQLSRRVFGKAGARLVTLNLMCFAVSWYALSPLFLSDALVRLMGVQLPLPHLAAGLAVLMALNNFFGFRGIAAFAQYFAAPVFIIWVSSLFVKAVTTCPVAFHSEGLAQTFAPFPVISAVVIGYSVWGNEPDFWRHGKPCVAKTALPLIIALAFGWVIFGTTGWMLARSTGVTDASVASDYAYAVTFGGNALAGIVVLSASYFAFADSCLYGAINAWDTLVPTPRRRIAAVFAMLGATVAFLYALSGSTKAIESVASLSCILLPLPMVIVLADWLIVSKFRPMPTHPEIDSDYAENPWPACVAFAVGASVGLLTSGFIPNTQALQVGICPLQAWIGAALTYLVLAFRDLKSRN